MEISEFPNISADGTDSLTGDSIGDSGGDYELVCDLSAEKNCVA